MDEDRAIAAKYDSITLYTGEEGRGKSYTMLARQKLADRAFNGERVHFGQEGFMEQGVALNYGDAIQLDEFKGHKRQAMHGFRMEILTFLKERRNLRLRVAIGYPQFDQFETDIRDKRLRYWAHKPSRNILEVSRREVITVRKVNGEVESIIKWPLMGRFHIPEPRGQLIQDYEERKEAFTRRLPEEHRQARRVLDEEVGRGVVGEILAGLAFPR